MNPQFLYLHNFDCYAKMGVTCETSGRELIDNTKFFQPYDPLYDRIPTVMYQYPGYNSCECPAAFRGASENTRELPESTERRISQKFGGYYRKSCCGRA